MEFGLETSTTRIIQEKKILFMFVYVRKKNDHTKTMANKTSTTQIEQKTNDDDDYCIFFFLP